MARLALRRLAPLVLLCVFFAPSAADAAPICTTSFVRTSGYWDIPANWSTGIVPSAYDVACVPSGAVVTSWIPGQAGVVWAPDASVVISGGTLTVSDVANQSQVKDLTLTGSGRLAGGATLSISGTFDWSAGAMAGSGVTILASGASGTIHSASASYVTLDARTLRNDGTLTLSAGSLRGDSGSLIDNRGTLRVNSQDMSTYGGGLFTSMNGANARLSNTGTVVKSSGSGLTRMGFQFDNQGSVSASTGELSFGGAGMSAQTATGSWAASSGAKVSWTQGPLTLASDIQLSGTISTSASVTTGSVQATGATLNITGNGALALTDASTISHVGSLSIDSGGTLTGAATLNVSDALDWSGGAMSGTGSTVLGTGASASVHPASTSWVTLDTRTLRSDGTLTMSSGSLRADNGALIDNRGTFRMNTQDTSSYGGGLFTYTGAPGRFSNTGSVLKTSGASLSRIGFGFDNKGTVSASSGQLWFGGGGITGQTATGSWAASTGASVTWAAGTFVLGSNIQLTGTIVSSATVTAASLQAPDGLVTIAGGSLAVSDAMSASQIKDVTLTAGTLTGAAALTVSHAFDWSGGVMSGSGSTVLATGATGTIHAPSASWVTLDTRTLRNDGTLTFAAGSLRGDYGSRIDNRGTFQATSEDNSYSGSGLFTNWYGAAAQFSNTGSVVKSSGTGLSRIGFGFDNQGTVSVNSGQLSFNGGGISGQTATGSWTAASSAQIQLALGTFALGANAQLSGNILSTATVTASSAQAPNASLTIAGGSFSVSDATNASQVKDLTLTAGSLTGAGALNVSGAFDWSGGTMTGTGSTVLGPNASGVIDPASSSWVTIDQRVLANRGVLTWTAGYVRGYNGAVLDNSGTFRANSESTWGLMVWEGAASVLNNTGTLTKTVGTGTTVIRWALGNSGSLGAAVGTLQTLGPVVPVGDANSSQAGAANLATPNAQRSCAGKPVDCATGNQYEIQTDLAIGGRGLGLQATRTYNAQGAAASTAPGSLGYGWTDSYSDHLVINGAYRTITVHHADGSTVVFSDYGSGNYRAPAWVQATLAKNTDGTYTYTLPSQVALKFAADGRLLSETDRNNNATTMTYTSGRLTSVTDPSGRSLTYSYNTDATIASITDPTGLVVSYTYTAGNLTGVQYTGVSSPQWAFGYDNSHQLTSMTDARGHTTTTSYDASHRVTSQTDALNRTRNWAYGTNDTTITNPAGDITHEVFDHGAPVTITRAQGTAAEATQTLSYNSIRALSSVTDASSRTTSFDYDAAGNRTSITIPGGRTTSWTYNATRDITSMTTPAGKTTRFVYDTHGNPTSVTRTLATAGHDPVDQTSSFAYDSAGNQTSATDALGHTTTFEYDDRGDQTSATDPLGHTTSWSYDDGSRVASMTSPRGHENGADPNDFTTAMQRDTRGRAIGSTDGLGRHAITSYDALGNVISQTDAEGRTSSAVYDAENQQTSVTQPDGTTSHTSYDANGQVATTTDPNGHTTSYARDALSRVTSVSDPLSHQTTFAYDLSGRTTSQTDAAGKTTSDTYSPAGELTAIDYQDPATHDVTFSYNADGQRTGMSDATGQTTFSYDSLGRTASTTDGDNHTIGYTYDLADRQTAVTYPGGDAVTHAYDIADRLTSISDWLGNTTSYSYDPDDNQTTVTYPTSTKDAETLAYDHAGRSMSETLKHDGNNSASIAYNYNATDQLLTQTGTGDLAGTHNYGYDTHGRLGTDNTDTMSYDDAGNLTGLRAASLNYNAADHLTTSTQAGDATAFSYNATGNRTQTAPPTGATTEYGYDQADQLTTVDDHSGPTINYTYAGDGLRATKTKSSQITHFTWDRNTGTPVLLAKDTTRYVYDQTGLALEQIENDGTISYLHHDRLGSTRLVTNAAGATQATYSYDAYGNRSTTGSSSVPFGYTGQYTDTDTGLIYLRARYYDPATGQFLNRDPLERLSREAYIYAGDDPANQTDPTGLLFGADTVLAGAIGGLVGGVAGAGGYLYGVANGAQSFSVSELAVSTAANAVGGAAAGACFGTVYVAVVACGAAGGAAASLIDDGLRPSGRDVLEGAAFGAVGGTLGQRLYALRGFRPYRWRNILNPGKNAQRLYAQGILGGAVGLTPSVFASAPAYGGSRC